MLTSKTGVRWYDYQRVATGSSRGQGNAILSRFPIQATSHCQLSSSRNAVHASVVAHGRTVNLWSIDPQPEARFPRLRSRSELRRGLAEAFGEGGRAVEPGRRGATPGHPAPGGATPSEPQVSARRRLQAAPELRMRYNGCFVATALLTREGTSAPWPSVRNPP